MIFGAKNKAREKIHSDFQSVASGKNANRKARKLYESHKTTKIR